MLMNIMLHFENDFVSLDIALRQNIDGSLRVGSGYVVSPRLLAPPFDYIVWEGKSYERLASKPFHNQHQFS